MNTTLVEYGIMQENSNVRVHVAPGTKRVFAFPTQNCIDLISQKEFRTAEASQPGCAYPTAKGLLIPCDAIPDVRVVRWNDVEWWKGFSRHDTTSEKGRKAAELAKVLIELGHIPLWVNVVEVNDIREDIKGTDMLVCGQFRIQVKCDYDAGPKDAGGTGNLYIQTYECNPHQYH